MTHNYQSWTGYTLDMGHEVLVVGEIEEHYIIRQAYEEESGDFQMLGDPQVVRKDQIAKKYTHSKLDNSIKEKHQEFDLVNSEVANMRKELANLVQIKDELETDIKSLKDFVKNVREKNAHEIELFKLMTRNDLYFVINDSNYLPTIYATKDLLTGKDVSYKVDARFSFEYDNKNDSINCTRHAGYHESYIGVFETKDEAIAHIRKMVESGEVIQNMHYYSSDEKLQTYFDLCEKYCVPPNRESIDGLLKDVEGNRQIRLQQNIKSVKLSECEVEKFAEYKKGILDRMKTMIGDNNE